MYWNSRQEAAAWNAGAAQIQAERAMAAEQERDALVGIMARLKNENDQLREENRRIYAELDRQRQELATLNQGLPWPGYSEEWRP